jgi:hypothetical protein
MKRSRCFDLAVADGIKEMLVMHGFTREKILNTMASNLAETLHIDYYVALNLQLCKKNVDSLTFFTF